jgi:deoxyribodipyrimidine photo-lyase
LPASIVWFRNDLRLADNPALIAGLGSGRPVIPVFVLDGQTPGIRRRGAASRWWLHHSLRALDASLRALGSRLILRHGPAERVIDELTHECEASAVYWNQAYDPGTRERDARIRRILDRRGVAAEGLRANLLFEPWEVTTRSGGPYKVFTAFWRACRTSRSPAAPLPAPRRLPAPGLWPEGDDLAAWRLAPAAPDGTDGFGTTWLPGEATAITRLTDFLDDALAHYGQDRDMPSKKATSRLSPHLAFGEISPRQIWHAVTTRGNSTASGKFLAELGWREFAYSLLFHLDDLARRNYRPEFDRFPWLDGHDTLELFTVGLADPRGETGRLPRTRCQPERREGPMEIAALGPSLRSG